jgi:hypothetical protein
MVPNQISVFLPSFWKSGPRYSPMKVPKSHGVHTQQGKFWAELGSFWTWTA